MVDVLEEIIICSDECPYYFFQGKEEFCSRKKDRVFSSPYSCKLTNSGSYCMYSVDDTARDTVSDYLS